MSGDLFKSYELGDEVEVDGVPGLVSFISYELRTMSVLIGKGCHKSEDTSLVIYKFSIESVSKGWTDREEALAALTPRPCRWYDENNPTSSSPS